MKKFISNNFKWIILVICLLLFFTITIAVYHKPAVTIDNKFYSFIDKNLISQNITPIVKVITNLGSAMILIIFAISAFILIKDKKIGSFIILNLALSASINFAIKNILQRERPIGFRLIEEKGYSFPSGHSMTSFAFYGLIIYFIYKNIENKYIKYISIAILSTIVLSVGISRIYLGVHYTTDVLAGFLLSLSYLIVFISLSKRFWNKGEIDEG